MGQYDETLAKLDPDSAGELHGGKFAANTRNGGVVWVADSFIGESTVGRMFKSADAPEETEMGLSNEFLLQKADLQSGSDLSATGDSTHGQLGIDQVNRFLQLMAADQVLLSDITTVTSRHSKWAQTVLQSGGRMLRPGVESTVGASSSPAVSTIDMNTGFFKLIAPVSDEFFEDTTADDADAAIAAVIADQVGYDVEDLALNSKAADDNFNDNDAVYDVLPDGGFLAQAEAGSGLWYDATADGQDFQTVLRQLLTGLPNRALRGMVQDGRFYVPVRLEQTYRDALSSRGTNLGDVTLQGTAPLSYQGISIKSVPAMYVRTDTTPDVAHVLLANRRNLYLGVERSIKIETWRDPREGAKSWVVTTRFDA